MILLILPGAASRRRHSLFCFAPLGGCARDADPEGKWAVDLICEIRTITEDLVERQGQARLLWAGKRRIGQFLAEMEAGGGQ
jgi:hypothetical protein